MLGYHYRMSTSRKPSATAAAASTRADRSNETTFVLVGDWPSSGFWAYVVRNYLLAFQPDEPHRLWIAVDRSLLTVDEVACLLAPLTASFGTKRFPTIILEDDPTALPPGDRVVPITLGPTMAKWSREHFRAIAMGQCKRQS